MTDPIKGMLKRQSNRAKQEFESYSFANGLVKGKVGIDGDNLTIYEWRCYEEKNGHTTRALKSLRERFKQITISSIGAYQKDESWKYWLHILSKGLVDILEDDQGNTVPFNSDSCD